MSKLIPNTSDGRTFRVAFDPGQSTGMYINSVLADHQWVCTYEWEELVEWAVENAQESQIWIVEAFNLMPSKTSVKTFSSFPEVEVIGMLRGLAQGFEVPFVTVSPGVYKPFASNIQVPTELGKLDRHQQDAYRLYKYAERFLFS